MSADPATAADTGVGTGNRADPGVVLAASVAADWAHVVAAAIVGLQRTPVAPPSPGWGPWCAATDPAVALLDRAAALVVARRAGVAPAPAPSAHVGECSVDPRPRCPPPLAVRLGRILRGEHELLLPEWFVLHQAAGVQLPWAMLPRLLLAGRSHPRLDRAVRDASAGRAGWLIDAVPELGVAREPRPAGPADAPFEPVAPRPEPADEQVRRVVEAFRSGHATWVAAPQLRLAVAGMPAAALPRVSAELSRLAFDPHLERTRADLVDLAEFRHAMHLEFAEARSAAARPGAPIVPPSHEERP